jgi:protein-tyrosine-phosphatase
MRILFLCVENAGRSQMAEGFAKALAPSGVEIFSAGSTPAKALNPAAVEAMREKGIDIAAQVPKGLNDLSEGTFDWVVGMGCGDACPSHRAKKILTWDIPNPKGQPIEVVRQIRDRIESRVKELLETAARPV